MQFVARQDLENLYGESTSHTLDIRRNKDIK